MWKSIKSLVTRTASTLENVVASVEAGSEYIKAEANIALSESLDELNLSDERIVELKSLKQKLREL